MSPKEYNCVNKTEHESDFYGNEDDYSKDEIFDYSNFVVNRNNRESILEPCELPQKEGKVENI